MPAIATLVFGMQQSLDGYVDHERLGPPAGPDAGLWDHFVERVRATTACIYGRRMYEIMRYWDEDEPDWDTREHAFAAAWRDTPKWVVSRSLKSVGPNAMLVARDVEAQVRRLKAELDGEIEIAGPELAGSLTGLIDVYAVYVRPVVFGSGRPLFVGTLPHLRLVASDRITEGTVRLTYVPA